MTKFQVLFDVTVAQLSVRTCGYPCDQDQILQIIAGSLESVY